MDKKQIVEDFLWAFGKTILAHGFDLLNGLILGPTSKWTVSQINPRPNIGGSRLFTARALSKIAQDGAFLDGPSQIGYAKYAIRKGMPGPGEKRMAIENPPHSIDDFDGEITNGYGKGTKKLLYSGNAVIKRGSSRFVGKVNIHEHKAERAGLHYDFVAEGIDPGTDQFEVNIPAGQFKGRYAFVSTDKLGTDKRLLIRMQDRSVLMPKPKFNLKGREFLAQLDTESGDIHVEWKPDGSMANIKIEDNRAIFRSHREEGEPYYDKLPAIEWLSNTSRLWSNRKLFPGPDQNGTVLKGELFHPEGAARVGGILNSGADKAVAYQQGHGPIEVYVWDIAKLRGRDVSTLPYSQRREIYESVVSDISRFNNRWHTVPSITGGGFVSWYDGITTDKRGLPWSEGVVIKRGADPAGTTWQKVKFKDTADLRIVEVIEGAGKRAGKVGRLLVESEGGGRGEIGAFRASDQQLKWIWDNKDFVTGQVIEAEVQEMTKAGAPRAGIFVRFHPSKSDVGLLMYALDDYGSMYSMKTAAGWKHK